MNVSTLQAALVCLLSWKIIIVEGVTFSLNGSSVINDNRGRISVYDLEVVGENDFSSALKCISERTVSATPQLGTGVGSFYLDGDSPFCCDGGPNGIDRFGGITFGWSGNSADEDDRRVYSLRRRTPNPDEGYFTCIINIDNRQERGLYILYPITEITAAIEVETGTSTFRVRCTSTGGRALNMAISGPNGYNFDITNIEAVGIRRYHGSDTYTGATGIISGGKDGDVYRCNVTSSSSTITPVTVKIAAPIIISLELRAPTTVRVWWTRPELSVTGYMVHYTLAGGIGSDGTQSVGAGSTGTEITGLTGGQTYIITVEVTSDSHNILPGVSDGMNITLPPDYPRGVETALEPVSVRVSWEAVDNADSYTVTFSQAQGINQEGLCPNDYHTTSLIVSAPTTTVSIPVGGDVESAVTDMLRAFTTYEVAVKAFSYIGTGAPSESTTVLTQQTSAGQAPGDLRAKAQSSTEIFVQWSGLSTCRLVNGRIIGYRVQFTTTFSSETRDLVLGDGMDHRWWSGGELLLTGLTPLTQYSISVAAVDENGHIGMYSNPVTLDFDNNQSSNTHASNNRTPLIVGVMIGVLGIAVGISGLVGGAVIVKKCKKSVAVPKPKQDVYTEINPAYGAKVSP